MGLLGFILYQSMHQRSVLLYDFSLPSAPDYIEVSPAPEMDIILPDDFHDILLSNSFQKTAVKFIVQEIERIHVDILRNGCSLALDTGLHGFAHPVTDLLLFKLQQTDCLLLHRLPDKQDQLHALHVDQTYKRTSLRIHGQKHTLL